MSKFKTTDSIWAGVCVCLCVNFDELSTAADQRLRLLTRHSWPKESIQAWVWWSNEGEWGSKGSGGGWKIMWISVQEILFVSSFFTYKVSIRDVYLTLIFKFDLSNHRFFFLISNACLNDHNWWATEAALPGCVLNYLGVKQVGDVQLFHC